MATALHRSTLEIRHSVDPTELPGDPGDWLFNPDFSAVETVPKRYWKVVDDAVLEMDEAEKAVVNAAELAAYKRQRIEQLAIEAEDLLARHTNVHAEAMTAIEAARTRAEVDSVTLGKLNPNPFERALATGEI
jgi:hypothetical protein